MAKRKAYMERSYHEMKLALSDAEVTLLSDTVKIVFKTPVLFEFNEARILPDNFPRFERMAKVLNNFSRTEILIVGHTDSVGGTNSLTNRMLSLRRADSAQNMLAFYKVNRKRMDTWGLGAKEPVASNATVEGRALNRRVEFIVLYNYDKSTKPKN